MKTDKADKVSIVTTTGKVKYKRYVLRPIDGDERAKLVELTGNKSVVPLDDYLGLSKLPFKMSIRAMLEVAYWAQNQGSYERAEDVLRNKMGIDVNDTTIRQVTNYVGNLVFEEDCRRAEAANSQHIEGTLSRQYDIDGVLYLEADGSALNTRTKNAEGSTWRENKLGEAFNSANIMTWVDKNGKEQRRILGKEYISYIGTAGEFRKHMLSLALRNGYGRYKETVLLSDGATWIRNMVQDVFPGAQQILDFFHLCENVNKYANYIFSQEARRKAWCDDICAALKNSDYARVLRELSASKNGVPKGCEINLYNYIVNNERNIDYKYYISKGYFIGSGAIESGNKTILQQRLKQAGMRWNADSAQPLLTLRAKSESKLWQTDVVDLLFRTLV